MVVILFSRVIVRCVRLSVTGGASWWNPGSLLSGIPIHGIVECCGPACAPTRWTSGRRAITLSNPDNRNNPNDPVTLSLMYAPMRWNRRPMYMSSGLAMPGHLIRATTWKVIDSTTRRGTKGGCGTGSPCTLPRAAAPPCVWERGLVCILGTRIFVG